MGPMCRYASDLALLFKVQSGPDLFKDYAPKFELKVIDLFSMQIEASKVINCFFYYEKINLSSLKYYVMADIGGMTMKISKSVKDAINNVLFKEIFGID